MSVLKGICLVGEVFGLPNWRAEIHKRYKRIHFQDRPIDAILITAIDVNIHCLKAFLSNLGS